ncbi:MAG TPA: hypothetical protein DGG94_09315 [Micromonosporaceae bacterium]|nr:hypothetical protein [Micromonosporaceae bacterium]
MDVLIWSVVAGVVTIAMGLWVRSYLRRERKAARIRAREAGEARLYDDQPSSPCRRAGPDTGPSASPESEQVNPSST